MNKEPETYDELMRKKRIIELTKYYELSESDLEEIYAFLEINPNGIVKGTLDRISLYPTNDSNDPIVKAVKCINRMLEVQ